METASCLTTADNYIFQNPRSIAFRPEDQVCVLRSYIPQRETLIKEAATPVQRMQKALIQSPSSIGSYFIIFQLRPSKLIFDLGSYVNI
jgi:hypothetical protein